MEYTASTLADLERKTKEFKAVCGMKGIAFEGPLDPETTLFHWETRRNSFRLLKSYVTEGVPVPIIEDISVARSELGGLFDDLDAIMDTYGFEYVFHGHIADGSIRVFPVVDLAKPGAVKKLLDATRDVFEMVIQRGGTISTDHNDGIVRTPFLPLQYNKETLRMFKEIKRAFDPQNIFNPNKKLSVTKTYLKNAIKKELTMAPVLSIFSRVLSPFRTLFTQSRTQDTHDQ